MVEVLANWYTHREQGVVEQLQLGWLVCLPSPGNVGLHSLKPINLVILYLNMGNILLVHHIFKSSFPVPVLSQLKLEYSVKS